MTEQVMGEEAVTDGAGSERRKRQRFLAKRWGSVCFWVRVNGVRLPVNDLSLEGFSAPCPEPFAAVGQTFRFVLQLEGIPDEVCGEAVTMNFVFGAEGGVLGCRFASLEGDGAMRLHDWLTIHVISTATVRISESEAAAIVSGPSLI